MNGKAKEQKEKKSGVWSRRGFFTHLGWGSFGAFGFFSLVGFVRSAFPRVLFQPRTRFKAGEPNDYVFGEVNEKFKQEYRVWIVREEAGLYALFAKYTHLGCTHGGYQRRISSNVRVMAVASTKTELTSKVRPLGLWTGLRLRLEKTGSSRWRKGFYTT